LRLALQSSKPVRSIFAGQPIKSEVSKNAEVAIPQAMADSGYTIRASSRGKEMALILRAVDNKRSAPSTTHSLVLRSMSCVVLQRRRQDRVQVRDERRVSM
jgi:hypothetical protein